MEKKQKTVVALLYDFDKTLCTQDMQNYSFIPSLGMSPHDFWEETNEFVEENQMDGILAYMYRMVRKSREKGVPLTRETLRHCGQDISFFPGVTDWFSRISRFGDLLGIEVEHYVISSGLREIIEGTEIANYFKEVYACEFFYDENGIPVWPKLAVNFTAKTQFIYRINKGVLNVSDDKALNASMPDEHKRISFVNMVYIGDGLSDVPCMKMMRSYGGQAIGMPTAVQWRNSSAKSVWILSTLPTTARVRHWKTPSKISCGKWPSANSCTKKIKNKDKVSWTDIFSSFSALFATHRQEKPADTNHVFQRKTWEEIRK